MLIDIHNAVSEYGLAISALLGLLLFYRWFIKPKPQAKPVPRGLDGGHNDVAEALKGTRITLQNALYPGSSKLEVRGRYWKVAATRDFAAGSVVEIVGYKGDTLNIVASELSRYGHEVDERLSNTGSVALTDFKRDDKIEAEYGARDLDYWRLFQDAEREHRKLPLIYAYHVMSGLKGMSLEQARAQMNTYTLALYDHKREGQYLQMQKQMYSQPRIYNFLYMDGKWTGTDPSRYEEEINGLIAALHSEWAVRYRGDITSAMVLRAVMMIRKQQL